MPEAIEERIEDALGGEQFAVAKGHRPLKGRHILVTAGPTWEAIDPVRYIANRSSGKQGFAPDRRSEEHTSELPSLMRISYAVFCLKQQHSHLSTYHTISAIKSYNI